MAGIGEAKREMNVAIFVLIADRGQGQGGDCSAHHNCYLKVSWHNATMHASQRSIQDLDILVYIFFSVYIFFCRSHNAILSIC